MRALGLLVLALCASSPAHAGTALELRVFTDVTARRDRGWPVRPFIRFESRFRDAGLVYEKVSVGGRGTLAPWLDSSLYVAHNDLVTPVGHDDLFVADAILHRDLGPISVKVRVGNEWHATAAFYRYRQLHELRVIAWKRCAPWVVEELRVDSDERRINQHNLLAGFDLPVGGGARLTVQADWEMARRRAGEWSSILAPGLVLASAW